LKAGFYRVEKKKMEIRDTELIKLGDTISSRIKTDKQFGLFVQDGYRVTWIEWDSAFRDTDLQIGDVIIALDGEAYRDVPDGNVSGSAIGQYGEEYAWTQAGARDGQAITLTVVRDGQQREISGELRAHRFYYTTDGKQALAPGGPVRLASDGFSGSWASWYETLVKKQSFILDSGWERTSFNNARELKEHLGHQERIDYLTKNHTGTFAETVKADWERVRENLRGRRFELTEDDLAYRQLGQERARAAAAAAETAWQKMLEELAPESRDTFPTPHPDQRADAVDKIVVLPWVTPREMTNDLGKTFAVVGSNRDGFYFIDLNSEAAYRFYTVYYRFRGLVNPNVAERCHFVGRILDDPRIITYRGQAVMGLMVDIVAARAGSGEGEMFVDLRGESTDEFAGEAELRTLRTVELSEDQSPQQVMQTMVSAIQQADQDTWRRVFANWRAWARSNGQAYLNRAYNLPDHVFGSSWERARRLMLGDVYDVRVDRVTPIRTLGEANPETGAPRIQEVTVYLDHIGLVDGEYRAFSNVNVHRKWILQRLGDGPWRVTDVTAL